MKKLTSALLAIIMVVSLSVGAMAQAPAESPLDYGTETVINGENVIMVDDINTFLAMVESNNTRAASMTRASHTHNLVDEWIGFQEYCYNGSENVHVLLAKYRVCVGPTSCGAMFGTAYSKIEDCHSSPKCTK